MAARPRPPARSAASFLAASRTGPARASKSGGRAPNRVGRSRGAGPYATTAALSTPRAAAGTLGTLSLKADTRPAVTASPPPCSTRSRHATDARASVAGRPLRALAASVAAAAGATRPATGQGGPGRSRKAISASRALSWAAALASPVADTMRSTGRGERREGEGGGRGGAVEKKMKQHASPSRARGLRRTGLGLTRTTRKGALLSLGTNGVCVQAGRARLPAPSSTLTCALVHALPACAAGLGQRVERLAPRLPQLVRGVRRRVGPGGGQNGGFRRVVGHEGRVGRRGKDGGGGGGAMERRGAREKESTASLEPLSLWDTGRSACVYVCGQPGCPRS